MHTVVENGGIHPLTGELIDILIAAGKVDGFYREEMVLRGRRRVREVVLYIHIPEQYRNDRWVCARWLQSLIDEVPEAKTVSAYMDTLPYFVAKRSQFAGAD